MLKFNDGEDWLNKRIGGVISAYIIPDEVFGVAVDIGSNVGAFGIVNHSKFNRIIAIEPAYETFLICKKNLENYKNIEVHQLAVSDVSDSIVKLRQYKDDSYSGNATTLEDSNWYRDDEFEEVKTISLEDIFIRNSISNINYLKVDCEGGEYKFLMNKDLTNIDYIGIEIHIQLGALGDELMKYIEKTHNVYKMRGNGKSMHFEVTYKNKNI